MRQTLTPRNNLDQFRPINLTCMFLDCGRKPGHPERTHAWTRRTCKLQPLLGFEPGTLLLWGNGANHQTTVYSQFMTLHSLSSNRLCYEWHRLYWILFTKKNASLCCYIRIKIFLKKLHYLCNSTGIMSQSIVFLYWGNLHIICSTT